MNGFVNLRPMRFAETPLDEVGELIASDDWVAEQKMDGTRGLVGLTPIKHVRWIGNHGGPIAHTAATQHLSDITAQLRYWLNPGPHTESDYVAVLDGEIMTATGEYRIFDLPYLNSSRVTMVANSSPFAVRRAGLDVLAAGLDPERSPRISLVRQAWGAQQKQEMLRAVAKAGGEGLMLKHVHGLYTPGQHNDAVRKVKFTKTADVIVTARDVGGTRNAQLAVYDPADGGHLVGVGACSMIGKPDAKVGDVIEVTYLYWTGQALYQPRMIRIRDDKRPRQCTTAQLSPYSRDAV
jgi:hypothetical protein